MEPSCGKCPLFMAKKVQQYWPMVLILAANWWIDIRPLLKSKYMQNSRKQASIGEDPLNFSTYNK